MIEKWKTLSSRYVLREKWATVRVDTCQLPTGEIKDDYYVLEYPNWVNAVAQTSEGKIILVRQYRLGADIISLELPGGVADEGENLADAIARELLEETGYVFENSKLVASLNSNPATSDNMIYTFLLTGGKKVADQQLDPHEFLEVEEYSVEEVKELLKAQKIAQSMHVAGLYYGLAALET